MYQTFILTSIERKAYKNCVLMKSQYVHNSLNQAVGNEQLFCLNKRLWVAEYWDAYLL